MRPDADAFPVSTYADAKRWLFTYSQVEDWAFDRGAELPLEARLVCDMFWIKASQLKRELVLEWASALPPDIPRRAPQFRPRRWGR